MAKPGGTMRALRYSKDQGLHLQSDQPIPVPGPDEALIRVVLAGICSTDLELIKGYVPGYDSTLGHEFVGVVEQCAVRPDLVNRRCVGEINCPCAPFEHPDPTMVRNHAPERTVLGIIARDGAMAEYCTLPASNLHLVPDSIPDELAAFAEPLAAACRLMEQGAVSQAGKVAVVGDGKLGLLVAQMLLIHTDCSVVHFGRHQSKLDMIQGSSHRRHTVTDVEATKKEHAQAFDCVVEASGSSQGILLATALCRPLGTVVLKSTCSLEHDPGMPPWSAIANDIVVNEKTLVGSRCGPFSPALAALQRSQVQLLLRSMTSGILPLSQGMEAVQLAKTKGTLKVLLRCS